jgi:hypothetical protein
MLTRRPPGIVVGIGGGGVEEYRTAVRLGAEEARLRQVPLRLVHGSRPALARIIVDASTMEFRQRRGRRLVNGAARELAATSVGRTIQIETESSPRTGVELLLEHARSAVMVVLQRDDRDTASDAGRTTTAVTADARGPTLVTRLGDRATGGLAVLVVVEPGQDPAAALTMAFAEASLRKLPLTVLGEPGGEAAVLAGVIALGERHADVDVRYAVLVAALLAVRVRRDSEVAALLVLTRSIPPSDPRRSVGTVSDLADSSACPVLLIAPDAVA